MHKKVSTGNLVRVRNTIMSSVNGLSTTCTMVVVGNFLCSKGLVVYVCAMTQDILSASDVGQY